MKHVLLDPDGNNPFGLAVIVLGRTGIKYENQCGGSSCDQRSAEGFLVLCPSRDSVGRAPNEDLRSTLADFFHRHFRGVRPLWNDPLMQELGRIVEHVVFWRTEPGLQPDRTYLRLDISRIVECVEAWIPVVTAWGPGFLVTKNPV